MSLPRCLTIAGSDSSGGAGIQADLSTFHALGCYGMSAITAVTAQNTEGVEGMHAMPPEFVARQIALVAADVGVDAAKTGMLHSAEIIRAVVGEVRRWTIRPLVVDPVMVASSGDRLLRQDAVGALRDELLPFATVVTPNLSEAEVLAGFPITDRESAYRAARAIRSRGAQWVLLKGGDRALPDVSASDESNDVLFGESDLVTVLTGRRIHGAWHGTGCTLSAAICARLARGDDVVRAVREAKSFLQGALEHAEPLGRGRGPVNHLWRQATPV